ncbi:MAG: hypothetical protein PHP70_12890 [Gallionella sp.]|nr:hypothetical protein [Gallionella sp.]
MQKVSRFRGMSGEVMRQFMSPFTLLSALPILFVFALLLLAVSALGGRAGLITAPVFLITYTMIAGHFALPALQGEFDSGFLGSSSNGSKLWFLTGRYLALAFVFLLPVTLLLWVTMKMGVLPGSAAAMPEPLAALQQNAVGLPMAILALLSMFMLTLCFIIAIRAGTLREAFGRDAWIWLFSDRRADLPIFYASLIGGIVIFLGIYLTPFALLAFFVFEIQLQSFTKVSDLFYLWTFSASPILFGRMCGAFVAGKSELDYETQSILNLLGIVPPADSRQQELPLEFEPPSYSQKRLSFDEMVAKTRALPIDAMFMEIDKAETRLAAQSHDPYTVVELAMLYRKAGETEKALATAATAITQAVNDGYTEIGVSLFRGFAKERADLGLDTQTLEIIGNVLLLQELVLDAGWCLHESAINSGDILKAQKKLLHVASVAEETQKYAEAIALYDFFMAAYPDTNLAQYARQGKNRAEAALA